MTAGCVVAAIAHTAHRYRYPTAVETFSSAMTQELGAEGAVDYLPQLRAHQNSLRSEIHFFRHAMMDDDSTKALEQGDGSVLLLKESYESQQEDLWSIFYNLFIPSDPKARGNTISIVIEQLQSIFSTMKNQGIVHEPTFFYNLIGDGGISSADIQELCRTHAPGLRCEFMQHYENGDERVTLNSLHQFCLDDEHQNYRVTYLHPKGSFHPSEQQNNWRRSLTDAALHGDCLNPPDNSCNLCGLLFLPQFTSFIPGNMWTASCSYIKGLLSPYDFHDKIEDATGEILLLRAREQLRAGLYPNDRRDRFGLDRYSSEHWVGSHPDVTPCDLDMYGRLSWVVESPLSQDEMKFQMAPHATGHLHGKRENRFHVLTDEGMRLRETFYLPGLLFKWSQLYGKAPPRNSWAWSWFPDGAFWRRAYEDHGLRTVELLTLPYYEHEGKPRSEGEELPVLSSFQRSAVDESRIPILNFDDASLAIFYQLWPDDPAHGEANLQTFDRQISAINHQLRRQGARAIIYIALVNGRQNGNESMTEIDVHRKCAEYENIECYWLPSLSSYNHGQSLSDIHEFCSMRPQSKVAFVHNNIDPLKMGVAYDLKENVLVALSAAIASPACLEGIGDAKSEDVMSYNVCSLQYSSLFDFTIPGNVFASRCDYVNKLIEPQDFENMQRDAAKSILLAKTRGTMTTDLPDGSRSLVEKLGFDRYAVDHWIGSHPSFTPCQAAHVGEHLSDFSSTFESGDYLHDEKLFLKTIQPNVDGVHLIMEPSKWREIMEFLKLPADKRRKESGLLAGHLLRWSLLYDAENSVPQHNSWIWSWFPDGEFWRVMVEQHGQSVGMEIVESGFDSGKIVPVKPW
eukprot:CAMPEP_0176004822 /NCGR_PEP_ID=MMETSP0120_2-20121206/1891_1 /TAXON_ID=160619 /ORGANISM="Kryptoperidinium foliaceum, Strain CCMP 1326" /LENGTH=852 /DNA_ID=CAMNT_0017337515 /DNA_START=166 /DNA_END=2721 /DNA_ORIENTATION=+